MKRTPACQEQCLTADVCKRTSDSALCTPECCFCLVVTVMPQSSTRTKPCVYDKLVRAVYSILKVFFWGGSPSKSATVALASYSW